MSGDATGGGCAIIPGSTLPGLIVSDRGSVLIIGPFSWSVGSWSGMGGISHPSRGGCGGGGTLPLSVSWAMNSNGGACPVKSANEYATNRRANTCITVSIPVGGLCGLPRIVSYASRPEGVAWGPGGTLFFVSLVCTCVTISVFSRGQSREKT